MSATPEIHDVSDLDTPTFDTLEGARAARNACDHDDVKLIHGPPSVDVAHICLSCGDLL